MSTRRVDPTTQQLIDTLDVAAFYVAHVSGFKVNGHLNVKVDCPFECGGGLSFSVDKERGLYLCHRCGAKGSPWGFLEQKGYGPSQIRSALMDFQRSGVLREPANRKTRAEKVALGPIVKTYDYVDEGGALLFQVTRHDPKDFRQRHRGPDGEWINNIVGVRRVLYGLPGLIEAAKARWTIYIVEGEKDAEAINGLDSGGEFFATTAPMGARAKWLPEFTPFLAGANVVIVADKGDEGDVGVQRALDVRFHIRPVSASVRIVQAKTGKDAFDHVAAGHTLAEFVELPEPRDADTPDSIVVLGSAIDLYDASVIGKKPEFDVENLFRRAGIHLAWAPPGTGKTWTQLRWQHEMMAPDRVQRPILTGHADLKINRRWGRVLWISTEEDASALRYKADYICRGMGIKRPEGQFLFRWAPDPKQPLTLDDLELILDIDGPVDAVVMDSLTGLRPKTVDGQKVKWDADNDAANTICLKLRGISTERNVHFTINHHTGRDVAKGYRGPVEWWASSDVMYGLIPDEGRNRVKIEKNRDGKQIKPFYLSPAWTEDRYTLTYDGVAEVKEPTKTEGKVLSFLAGVLSASQEQIRAAVGCSVSTIKATMTSLRKNGKVYLTGARINRSPVYKLGSNPDEPSDSETGRYDDE